MGETVATRREQIVKYQDHNGKIHACAEGEMPKGPNWFWTLCQKDVPANGAFISPDESVSCHICAEKIKEISHEA